MLNGGYKDDQDEGDWIYYTGEGGQDGMRNQVADQDPDSSGNAALTLSHTMGTPVRVVRGFKGDRRWSPKSGYRYDGLYEVLAVERLRSSDGPLVMRYTLQRLT